MSKEKMTEIICPAVTEDAVNAAIELLQHAKFHQTELAQVKTELLRGCHMDEDLHRAFRVMIARALTNPGGRVERTLRENGFSEGSH